MHMQLLNGSHTAGILRMQQMPWTTNLNHTGTFTFSASIFKAPLLAVMLEDRCMQQTRDYFWAKVNTMHRTEVQASVEREAYKQK